MQQPVQRRVCASVDVTTPKNLIADITKTIILESWDCTRNRCSLSRPRVRCKVSVAENIFVSELSETLVQTDMKGGHPHERAHHYGEPDYNL